MNDRLRCISIDPPEEAVRSEITFSSENCCSLSQSTTEIFPAHIGSLYGPLGAIAAVKRIEIAHQSLNLLQATDRVQPIVGRRSLRQKLPWHETDYKQVGDAGDGAEDNADRDERSTTPKRDPNGPGEMGLPVKLKDLTASEKEKVRAVWAVATPVGDNCERTLRRKAFLSTASSFAEFGSFGQRPAEPAQCWNATAENECLDDQGVRGSHRRARELTEGFISVTFSLSRRSNRSEGLGVEDSSDCLADLRILQNIVETSEICRLTFPRNPIPSCLEVDKTCQTFPSRAETKPIQNTDTARERSPFECVYQIFRSADARKHCIVYGDGAVPFPLPGFASRLESHLRLRKRRLFLRGP